MVKLLIQAYGTAIAIGIQSDLKTNQERKDEIELQFNSFWNFGATSGELSWNTEDFAYFWTTPTNLRKYLVESSVHRILNEHPNKFRGRKGGVMEHARQLANLRRAEFVEEDFRVNEFFDVDVYQISEQDMSMLRAEGFIADEMPEKVATLYV